MKKKTLLTTVTVIQLIILLSLSSYAWFMDRSNPSIEETEISVSAADGLLIKLAPDGEELLTVNLNEIFTDFSEFELKQVSSANANDFFYIDFGAGLTYNDPEFVKVEYEEDDTLDMVEYGFIDYNFYLKAEQYDKHIYLHKDTMMDGPAAAALRIAITIGEEVYIFGETPENGVEHPFVTEAIINEGTFDFGNIDPYFYTNQVVHVFSDKGGGRELSDDDPLDISKTFGIVDAESVLEVNVKIWLEGGDPDCTNALASTLLDLVIKFGSANVLLDAPDVFADNNNMTITNLDTTMEYTFDAEEPQTWTTVTDPNMTFSPGQTVYVRIAEVLGEAPPSEITEVNFD